MSEIIDAFLAECGKSAPNTAHTYKVSIKMSMDAIAKPLLSITKADVLSWLQELDAEDLALSTKDNRRKAMFALFDFAADRYDFNNPRVSKHAFDFTKPFGAEDHSAPCLSIDQIKALLDSAQKNPRDYCFLMILAHTGLRISEVVTIKIENIHLAERYLETGIEKIARKSTRRTGKPLQVVLSVELAAVLEDYLSFINRKSGWLFPSPSADKYVSLEAMGAALRRIEKRTGITFSAHSFRHSLITNRKTMGKIEDWESEVLMNHVPKSLENRVYLGKPVEFKTALYDAHHVMSGVA